jgi:hypothetical protein
VDFYKQYPMMSPYVGKNFHCATIPALLLIGESHYLPEGSSQHLSAERWYAGSSGTLSPEEIEYISTAAIVEQARAEGFTNKAHRSMWGNPFLEINQHGPNYPDYRRVGEDIAFYNFFLRPALDGRSLAVSPLDVEFANEALRAHLKEYRPTAVVFLSSLARNYLSEQLDIPFIATPHPCCPWWNRVSRRYGNKTGREILADFIKATNWPQIPEDLLHKG